MSFDAWVVGFGLSRVLIELKLMESPWAYGTMLITIFIDAYLLYIFFTVRRANTGASRASPVLPKTSVDNERGERMASGLTLLPEDSFEDFNTFLGYVIGILAILMVAHTFLDAVR